MLRWWSRRSRLRRLHRKLAMIDAHTAFVGGINLHDDRDNAGPEDAPRYDYAVRVCGPVVADIQHTMRQLWLSVAFGPLVAPRPAGAYPLIEQEPGTARRHPPSRRAIRPAVGARQRPPPAVHRAKLSAANPPRQHEI